VRLKKFMRLKKNVAQLITRERVCRVATVNEHGVPHLVPVCHVLANGKICFASGNDGRKVKNIERNPHIAVTVDLYSDDWAHIKGVMVQGTARLFSRGPRFRRIRALLYEKYPHYRTDAALGSSDSVVVEVTPIAVFDWELD
jgi:nitroimidazol reductase NimA-like FMN-containing flavoprotein (pyridoxamine 5'-phosphate oxidase superfamily)